MSNKILEVEQYDGKLIYVDAETYKGGLGRAFGRFLNIGNDSEGSYYMEESLAYNDMSNVYKFDYYEEKDGITYFRMDERVSFYSHYSVDEGIVTDYGKEQNNES